MIRVVKDESYELQSQLSSAGYVVDLKSLNSETVSTSFMTILKRFKAFTEDTSLQLSDNNHESQLDDNQ